MKKGVEVEAKFLCSESITPDVITALLEEQYLQVKWQPAQRQRDIYLDTPEGAFLKGGGAARVRELQGRWVGTYKGSAVTDQAVFSREEVEWELTPEEVERFRREGHLALPAHVQLPQGMPLHQLKPVLTVETLRRKAVVTDASGFAAELALDEVVFKGARGEAQRRELELELKAGDPARLRELAEILHLKLSLQPSRTSKFATGIELVG